MPRRGPVPKTVIVKMVEAGYHPTTLALTLGIDVEDIMAVLPDTVRRKVVANDDMISEGMRVLAWRTIEEAMRVLDEGTPQQRMMVISKFGGQLSRVIGDKDKDPLEDLRSDFDALMKRMTGERGEGEQLAASD